MAGRKKLKRPRKKQGSLGIERDLMRLKGVTESTGAVHDGQLHQIKMWGALAFGYTTWEAEVDPESRTVIFVLNKKNHPETLVKLVAGLDRSVHWLFGDSWGLTVKEGSKILYEGSRVKKDVNAERKQRAARTGSESVPDRG